MLSTERIYVKTVIIYHTSGSTFIYNFLCKEKTGRAKIIPKTKYILGEILRKRETNDVYSDYV